MLFKELGEIVAEFAPDLTKKNPRNSEGAFITLNTGEVLFVYSRFKGESCADFASADIFAAKSSDRGRTFYPIGLLLSCEEEGALNIMSLSLLRMQNGDIGLFYLVRETHTRLLMYLRRSDDEGKSWSKRVLCTPLDGFFVVNNDRVTRLSNGRIIIPAAVHKTGISFMNDEKPRFFDDHSEVMCFYSDDDGNSWSASLGKISMPYSSGICKSGLQEPGVIELRNGLLWGWGRTDLGRQFESFSADFGNVWTSCQPSRFTSPNSPLCMKRVGDSIIAIWNPIPEYNGRELNKEVFLGGRSPYVMAFSLDEGESFSEPVAFETDENSGFCYCAIHQIDDALLLAYCSGSVQDGGCLNRIRIRRIQLSSIYEKQ